MFGVITPPPKLTVLYECQSYGRKRGMATAYARGKCPDCGGKNLRPVMGMVGERPRFPFVL